MKIYKTHRMPDGEVLALVDVMEVWNGLNRSAYRLQMASDLGENAKEFVEWERPVYSTVKPSRGEFVQGETALCCVRLEDLVKTKVYAVNGETCVIGADKVPVGVKCSRPRNDAILSQMSYTPVDMLRWAQETSGPQKPYDILVYSIVKTQDLVDMALGSPTAILDTINEVAKTVKPGKYAPPASPLVSTAEKKIRDREAGTAKASCFTKSESEAWSAALRAKVEASKAEEKRKADALVGWNPYEGDDL